MCVCGGGGGGVCVCVCDFMRWSLYVRWCMCALALKPVYMRSCSCARIALRPSVELHMCVCVRVRESAHAFTCVYLLTRVKDETGNKQANLPLGAIRAYSGQENCHAAAGLPLSSRPTTVLEVSGSNRDGIDLARPHACL